MSQPTSIEYATPQSRRSIEGSYIAIAIVGICIAGFFALVYVLWIIGVWMAPVSSLTAIAESFHPIISVSVNIGLVVAFIGSFSRAEWARRMLVPLLIMQAADASLLIANSLLTLPGTRGNVSWDYLIAIAVQALPILFCFIALPKFQLKSKSRYLGLPTPVITKIDSTATPPQYAGVRFRISGVNEKTGEPVSYLSKAQTSDLAFKSAKAMGVSMQSLTIEHFDPTRHISAKQTE